MMKDMKDLRVMVIGAHPDDPDLNAGCTIMKLVAVGARVRFVSVCNGDKGHQTTWGASLAERRFGEAQASAKIFGVEDYAILGNSDCEVENTKELRLELTRRVRTFAPHIIFTHRICDYHADHRAVGMAVMDITYFLGVPGWCPEAPLPSVKPAVLFLRDTFTVPRELRPDVIVPVDDPAIRTRYLAALACHVSQFSEWLPFDKDIVAECPDWNDVPAREKFLTKHWVEPRKGLDARRFGVPEFKEVEVFEQSEYGRQMTADEMRDIFGPAAIVRLRGWEASR